MNYHWTNGTATLYQADAREIPLPDKSVHMCVTSPPYWGLRDYGLGQWQGGDAECGHEQQQLIAGGQNSAMQNNHSGSQGKSGPCLKCGAVNTPAGIGLEPTLGEWVQNVVEVMREVRRVLRDDGVVFLNLGDSYSANRGYQVTDNNHIGVGNTKGMTAELSGLAPKQLMGQPWRVAFALQDDGWILRSAIVWHKPNPMPESVTDRPTSAYEMVFMLVKQGRYFYDAEAVREPPNADSLARYNRSSNLDGSREYKMDNPPTGNQGGANARNVWSIATQGRSDSHFASFPDELARRCILAGTSARGVCSKCGAPWYNTKNERVQGLPRPEGPEPVHAANSEDVQGMCGGTTQEAQTSLFGTGERAGKAVAVEQQGRGSCPEKALSGLGGRPPTHVGGGAPLLPEESGATSSSVKETPSETGPNGRRKAAKPLSGRQTPCEVSSSARNPNAPRLAPNVGESETSVFLLREEIQQENPPDDGSCDTDLQGRGAHTDEHSRGVPFLQFGEAQQGAAPAVDGWRPTCDHDADTEPATVLDPFVGSGTTVAVAQALGRRGVGLDLNPEYLEIAVKRIGGVTLPMVLR